MTYEEAIKVIEDNKPNGHHIILAEACDVAIESLERMLKKDVIETPHTEKHVIYGCPNCKKIIPHRNTNYCERCGQHLNWPTWDWSDET